MNAFLKWVGSWVRLVKEPSFAGRALFIMALFLLGSSGSAPAVDPPPSARSIETLTVGGTTYTKVTIIDIGKRHVSFRSAQGFATVRLTDLDSGVQARLAGTAPEVTESTTDHAVVPSTKKSRKTTKIHARSPGASGGADPGADADEDEDEDSNVVSAHSAPVQWTARNIIGVSVLGLGALAVCIGHIWFICAGFHTSVMWGLILMFGSVVADIMFCVGHWDTARRPTYLQLAGLGLVVGGWKLFVR
jgi:hypothetical protein